MDAKATNISARRPRSARRVVALGVSAIVLVWIGWQIIGNTMADTRALTEPSAALQWRPNSAAALVALAEQELVTAKTPVDFAVIADLAKRALATSPLEESALRLLAMVAETQGDTVSAARLMGLASRRSLRDIVAQAWLFDQHAHDGQWEGALRSADVILRTRPDLGSLLLPTLTAIAERAPASLVAMLEKNPPWRGWFLSALPGTTEPSVTFAVLSGLENGPNAANASELKPYLDQLIATAQFDLAYLSWAHFLPDSTGKALSYIYDGDFETPVSGLPFDWLISPIGGAATDIVATGDPDRGHAVRVTFANTRVPYRNLSKLLVLPPGEYRLSGQARADNLANERGMIWQISCAEGAKQTLGTSPPVTGTELWSAFTIDFTVASDGCGGQWLTLELGARTPIEQQVNGEVWYDQLAIERIAASG